MDSNLIAVVLLQGIVIGIVGFDMVGRLNDRKRLIAAERKILDDQKVLSDLHNNATKNLKDLSDKVAAHEMAIKAPVAPSLTRRF